MLLQFHRFSELVLCFLLQEGVDQLLQVLIRGFGLLEGDVIIVEPPYASEFCTLLNLSRVEGVHDIFCGDL